jgi:hypothetical protein
MENPLENTIVIVSCPLSMDKNKVFKLLQDDKELVDAINSYSKYIKTNDDIETFNNISNIIITENGYNIAVYGEDIKGVIK